MMRKLTAQERALIVLGVALVGVGCTMVVRPRPLTALIQSVAKGGGPDAYARGFSKGECRAAGILAVLVGGALGAMAVFPFSRK